MDARALLFLLLANKRGTLRFPRAPSPVGTLNPHPSMDTLRFPIPLSLGECATLPDFNKILCSHPSPVEIGVNTIYYKDTLSDYKDTSPHEKGVWGHRAEGDSVSPQGCGGRMPPLRYPTHTPSPYRLIHA